MTVMSTRSKHLVLVVDDDTSVRESTSLLLTASGYDVNVAEDGFDAILQLGRAIPDVIISDLNMPRMSGFGTLRRNLASRSAWFF
jgi:CheY-like chemotaxis protein